jgi:hypothetical protein
MHFLAIDKLMNISVITGAKKYLHTNEISLLDPCMLILTVSIYTYSKGREKCIYTSGQN